MSLTLPFHLRYKADLYPLTAVWHITAHPNQPSILKIRVPFPDFYPESTPARDVATTERVAYLEMSFGDRNYHDEIDELEVELDMNPSLFPDRLFSDKYAYLRKFVVYPTYISEPSEERQSVRGLGRTLFYLALEIGIDQDLIDPDSLLYLEAYSDRSLSDHPVLRRVAQARARYLETVYPKEWQRLLCESEKEKTYTRPELTYRYLSRLKNNESLARYYRSLGLYPVIHSSTQSTEQETIFDSHSIPLSGVVEDILLQRDKMNEL